MADKLNYIEKEEPLNNNSVPADKAINTIPLTPEYKALINTNIRLKKGFVYWSFYYFLACIIIKNGFKLSYPKFTALLITSVGTNQYIHHYRVMKNEDLLTIVFLKEKFYSFNAFNKSVYRLLNI